MELDLSPELQAKLDEVAAQRGRDAKSLVKEAVERLADYDPWFVREVEKGLAEIERGDVLEHDQVGARLDHSGCCHWSNRSLVRRIPLFILNE